MTKSRGFCTAVLMLVPMMTALDDAKGQAVRSARPRALEITRTTMDFGGSPPGITSEQLLHVRAPSNLAAVSATVTGDPVFRLDSNNCSEAEDANYVSFPQCQIIVVFKPTALGPKTGTLTVTAQGRTWRIPLTGRGVINCRGNIVPCNYSDFFSGAFEWVSTVTMIADKSHPHASNELFQETSVTATVTNGKVVCQGRHQSKQTTWQVMQTVEMMEEGGSIAGTGLITVEFPGFQEEQLDDDVTSRDRELTGQVTEAHYIVKVSCPTWDGRRVSTSLRPGAGPSETMAVESMPASRDGDQTTDEQPYDANTMTLEGERTIDGIEDDPVNKISAKVRQKWSLRLNAPAGAFPTQ